MEADLAALSQFTVAEPAPGYWRVLFSNPPLNLLNSTSVVEIAELVKAIESDANLKVVVFASDHSDFFMARYDLADRSPVAFAPTDNGVTLFIDSMIRMNSASPITIAAIRGRTRGGGSEFALSCDLRFASLENSLLGQPEVGVGMLPAGGAIERLPALVGPARALEIIASSDDYDAVTAEKYGWINRAIPDQDLDAFVDRFAAAAGVIRRCCIRSSEATHSKSDDGDIPCAIPRDLGQRARPARVPRNLQVADKQSRNTLSRSASTSSSEWGTT